MAMDCPGQLSYQTWPASPERALEGLAQAVRTWFVERFGDPTQAQLFAWPALQRGENVLLCTPTGSGKTLAAMAPILSQMAESGRQCLYVAPLKALVRDVKRSIRTALKQLRDLDSRFGSVEVATRTGDTPATARRRIINAPPAILITTPESLAVMLSQRTAEHIFRDLRWIVVDEVHALAGTKRGVDLALSLERIEAGRQVQRIGLSATCSPLEVAARYLVGTDRPCTIASVAEPAPLELTIEPLWKESASELAAPFGFMRRLLARIDTEVKRNRTTLLFVNARSFAERLTWALKTQHPEWESQIAVHHSSLAAKRRREIESALKEGKLRAVVATTSLELGIDIGSVDGVVLVHPAREVVRLLQRVGRSGHHPRGPRRGLILAANVAELLESTVTAAASTSIQIEPLRIPEQPLDILCQHIVGLAMAGDCRRDDALTMVRRAFSYRNLSRSDFDACLGYLSGKDSAGESWLPARLRWCDDRFSIIDEATSRLLRRNLGTILREEGRPVKVQGEPSRVSGRVVSQRLTRRLTPLGSPEGTLSLVGEVDDAFAERIQPGDRFALGGRCWQYERQEDFTLIVQEVVGRPLMPRWQTNGVPLSSELADRLFQFRVRAAEILRDDPAHLLAFLCQEYHLRREAAQPLVDLFIAQEEQSEMPEAGVCFIEAVRHDFGVDYYFHTPLNRAGNDALARVISSRLLAKKSASSTALAADLGFLVSLRSRQMVVSEDWAALLDACGFEADLHRAMADSPGLRDRFGCVAFTGLMLLRNPQGGRRRVGGEDWAQRRLFDQVRRHDPDFPLLRQAVAEMQQEVCDAPAALQYLTRRPSFRCRALASPSPLAQTWTQVTFAAAELVEPMKVG